MVLFVSISWMEFVQTLLLKTRQASTKKPRPSKQRQSSHFWNAKDYWSQQKPARLMCALCPISGVVNTIKMPSISAGVKRRDCKDLIRCAKLTACFEKENAPTTNRGILNLAAIAEEHTVPSNIADRKYLCKKPVCYE